MARFSYFFRWLAVILAVVLLSYLLTPLPSFKAGLLREVPKAFQSALPLKVPVLSEIDKNTPSGLLIDSILSIVQNYYVDPDRVTHKKLLDYVLIGLVEENPQFKWQVRGDHLDLVLDHKKKTLMVPREFDDNTLLAVLIEISSMLDSANDQKPVSSSLDNFGANLVAQSLLRNLDAHSALLTRNVYRDLRQGTEGAFGGLGVLVGIRNQLLTVIKPLPRSPAQRFGFKKNDRIMAIDGVETFGYPLDQLVDHMRGDPGTSVNIRLLRDKALSSEEVILQREVVEVDSVADKVLTIQEGKILYMAIETFSSRTSNEVLTSLVNFQKKHPKGPAGIIIDLRSNAGGLLDQSVQVADLFLNKGRIVSTKGRREEVEMANKNIFEFEYPVVVLVNEDSASASEIVTGALQDNDRAIVIGQKSFGKGSVQTIFEIPGERAVKLTIARYYTPKGRSIQNLGITPDIWLQPVVRKQENLNLLGSHRYRNERFLPNHLVTSRLEHRLSAKEKFKSFYLRVSDDTGEPVDIFEYPDHDRELDIAKVLLSKVMKTYPHALPVGAQRSSHWLALATPEVRQRLSDWSQEVASYLDREYAILWQESLVQEVGDLQLHSKFPELNDYYSGDEIFIPYIVNNRSQLPADQVSVFMRSSSPYIETKEVLIGRLESGQSRRGDMKFRIPVYVTPGDYSLEMGLGSKGDIVSRDLLVYKFRVEEGARPKVVVTATISDNHRGKMDGVLEANESALLEVKLTNESHLAIRDLRVGIVNLSGRQILAQKTTELIDHLNAWEEKIVYLKVSGSSHIVSDTLQLGVLVDSQDIGLPIRHQVNLKGWPSRMALDLKATGH